MHHKKVVTFIQCFTVCSLAYLLYMTLTYFTIGTLFHNDFLLIGKSITTGMESGHFYLHRFNLNTPFFNLLISPIATLTWPKNFLLWQIVSLGLLITGFYLIYQTLSFKRPLLFLALSLFSLPTFINMMLGQFGSLCMFLFALFWRASRDKKEIIAGILLGMMISIKIFFGLFLFFFLAQKRWQVLFATTLTFLIVNLIVAMVFGVDVFIEYYNTLKEVTWYGHIWNASLQGALSRLFGVSKFSEYGIWHLPLIKNFLYWSLSALIIICLFRKSRKISNLTEFDFNFVLFACAMLFISPLGWLYYFPLLFIAYAILLHYIPRMQNKELLLILLSFSWVALNTPILSSFNESTLFIGKSFEFNYFIYTIGFLVLFFALWWGSKQPLQKNETAIAAWIYAPILGIACLCYFYMHFFYVGKLYIQLNHLISY